MNLLAIDTSSSLFSISLSSGERIEMREFEAGVTHSTIVLAEINKILTKLDLKISELDGIAFSSGPGSFTGIRIAAGVAYGLAYPHKIPIIPVSSLEVIASMSMSKYTLVALDARMNQVYIELFERDQQTNLQSIFEATVVSPGELPDILETIQDDLIFIGSGINLYEEKFKEKYSNVNYKIMQVKTNVSSFLAELAMKKLPLEFSLKDIQPKYVRNKVAFTISERLSNGNN